MVTQINLAAAFAVSQHPRFSVGSHVTITAAAAPTAHLERLVDQQILDDGIQSPKAAFAAGVGIRRVFGQFYKLRVER